jgi:hypothetical protein
LGKEGKILVFFCDQFWSSDSSYHFETSGFVPSLPAITSDLKPAHAPCTVSPTTPEMDEVGNSGVGKTCVLFRFSEDAFNSTFISTIGKDMYGCLRPVYEVELILKYVHSISSPNLALT